MFTINGNYAAANVYADVIDQQTIDQITSIVNNQVAENSKIAIMGDTHSGKGAVIGYTQTSNGRLCPNILGVDLACTVSVTNLGKLSNIDFNKLDNVIRTYVRSGHAVHENVVCDTHYIDYIIDHLKIAVDDNHRDYYRRSIGSIGGGNHFIEINKGSDDTCYLVVHCGSRRLGVDVHDFYMNVAQIDLNRDYDRHDLIMQLKNTNRHHQIEQALIEFDQKRPKYNQNQLAFLQQKDRYYDDYINDVNVCNYFAQYNHQTVVNLIVSNMNWNIDDYFVSIHNTIGDDHILRKGATQAHCGQSVIIPINMAFGSVLGKGIGNSDMNYSAPHGAGRILSRKQAREKISIEQYKNEMNGIFTTSVCLETVDEAPFAYKKFDDIKNCLDNCVVIQDIIKPVYNFKAGGE